MKKIIFPVLVLSGLLTMSFVIPNSNQQTNITKIEEEIEFAEELAISDEVIDNSRGLGECTLAIVNCKNNHNNKNSKNGKKTLDPDENSTDKLSDVLNNY